MSKVLALEPNEHVRAWLSSEYERNRLHRKKIRMPYDAFTTLVEDNGRSLHSIARSLDVKVQSVSALYRKYVAPLHGARRRPVWGREKQTEKYRKMLYLMPYIGLLARRATDAGHMVTPEITSEGNIAKKRLLINGNLCRLQVIKAAQHAGNGSSSVYACFEINLRRQQLRKVVILMTVVPGYDQRLYVVPLNVVRSLAGQRESIVIYIPLLHRRAYINVMPKVRWRRYEGRFNLLK